MKMQYCKLNAAERDQAIMKILDTLLDDSLPYSGEHRRHQWEKGWEQNLKEGDNTPKYFGKYSINRLDGEFVYGLSKDYEQKMLYTIVDALSDKYLSKSAHVYEFGCGTGHNLFRVKKYNPTAVLHGTDWARSSQKLLEKQGLVGHYFDYFDPKGLRLEPCSAVYTVASLEQVGTKYKKFVGYLIRNKPTVVVHIEPVPELLDPTNLLDYLSIKYMEKRHYLSGYLDYLRLLEKKGKIEILEARRSGIGSFFIDGYSIVVWRPL